MFFWVLWAEPIIYITDQPGVVNIDQKIRKRATRLFVNKKSRFRFSSTYEPGSIIDSMSISSKRNFSLYNLIRESNPTEKA